MNYEKIAEKLSREKKREEEGVLLWHHALVRHLPSGKAIIVRAYTTPGEGTGVQRKKKKKKPTTDFSLKKEKEVLL